jgi:hypothetical protein
MSGTGVPAILEPAMFLQPVRSTPTGVARIGKLLILPEPLADPFLG